MTKAAKLPRTTRLIGELAGAPLCIAPPTRSHYAAYYVLSWEFLQQLLCNSFAAFVQRVRIERAGANHRPAVPPQHIVQSVNNFDRLEIALQIEFEQPLDRTLLAAPLV